MSILNYLKPKKWSFQSQQPFISAPTFTSNRPGQQRHCKGYQRQQQETWLMQEVRIIETLAQSDTICPRLQRVLLNSSMLHYPNFQPVEDPSHYYSTSAILRTICPIVPIILTLMCENLVLQNIVKLWCVCIGIQQVNTE